MDVRKINNLWKFLGIRNNMPVQLTVDHHVNYRFEKNGIILTHQFNPKLWQESVLSLYHKDFQDKFVQQQFHHKRQQFGIKSALTSTHVQLFFPKELLRLKSEFEMDIRKDRSGKFLVRLCPFNPSNVYQILDSANCISRHLWKMDFFTESIRN